MLAPVALSSLPPPGPRSHLLTKASWTLGRPLAACVLVAVCVPHPGYAMWLLLAAGEA